MTVRFLVGAVAAFPLGAAVFFLGDVDAFSSVFAATFFLTLVGLFFVDFETTFLRVGELVVIAYFTLLCGQSLVFGGRPHKQLET